MSKKKRNLLWIDLVALILFVAIDQVTKYFAVLKLKNQPDIPIIKDVFELSYLENILHILSLLDNHMM